MVTPINLHLELSKTAQAVTSGEWTADIDRLDDDETIACFLYIIL